MIFKILFLLILAYICLYTPPCFTQKSQGGTTLHYLQTVTMVICSVKILLNYLYIAMVIFHPSTNCIVLAIKVSMMSSGVKTQAQLSVS